MCVFEIHLQQILAQSTMVKNHTFEPIPPQWQSFQPQVPYSNCQKAQDETVRQFIKTTTNL